VGGEEESTESTERENSIRRKKDMNKDKEKLLEWLYKPSGKQ
jgi:hypothetical protein